ncbi:hypothetical protein GCK32_004576 [Trichostrongylus colubriformis]|uniref:Uncharacterized protein n=1 Tax=Trichostrongylus colubriformis TaxID=6319 RepID=A0AAN8FYD6_TRICO
MSKFIVFWVFVGDNCILLEIEFFRLNHIPKHLRSRLSCEAGRRIRESSRPTDEMFHRLQMRFVHELVECKGTCALFGQDCNGIAQLRSENL